MRLCAPTLREVRSLFEVSSDRRYGNVLLRCACLLQSSALRSSDGHGIVSPVAVESIARWPHQRAGVELSSELPDCPASRRVTGRVSADDAPASSCLPGHCTGNERGKPGHQFASLSHRIPRAAP